MDVVSDVNERDFFLYATKMQYTTSGGYNYFLLKDNFLFIINNVAGYLIIKALKVSRQYFVRPDVWPSPFIHAWLFKIHPLSFHCLVCTRPSLCRGDRQKSSPISM